MFFCLASTKFFTTIFPLTHGNVIATGYSPLVLSATIYNPPFDSYFSCNWIVGTNSQVYNNFYYNSFSHRCEIRSSSGSQYSLTCLQTNYSLTSNLTFRYPLHRGILSVEIRCYASARYYKRYSVSFPNITVTGKQHLKYYLAENLWLQNLLNDC